ncbi:hypothetical protein HCI99_06100 [Listeria booriae]|uniref:Phage protein n=1 Tax=Listeria booriae TaxID=1552123 RepID=A0A7X0XBZ1_9LIST|nr:hypothetical protein [Listeria booriae]MBC1491393.1 hypothetical protein [Listeria booriae]
MPIQININKNYKEFVIGNKEYKVPLDDDTVKQYEDLIDSFEEQPVSKLEEGSRMIKQIFTVLLGESAFDEIYNICGKSTYVMTDIFKQISAEIEKDIPKKNPGNQYIKAKSNKKK